MITLKTIHATFTASLLAGSLLAGSLLAGSATLGVDYDLSWHTIDAGGGTSTGAGYVLDGTFGQPDTGVMSSGALQLVGGFWSGGAPSTPCVGDLDRNGIVDGTDLGVLLIQWGSPGSPGFNADFNGDGVVDGADLGLMLNAWGACP